MTWVKTITYSFYISNNKISFQSYNLLTIVLYKKEHEEKQNRFRALRNRQDLFQEEGILNLILEAIDKVNIITSQGFMVSLAGDESGQSWDVISGYLYQLLGL
jgi:hypothetical protein